MCDDVEDLHRSACAREEETYVDPSSGLTVFTAYAHLQRGKCCTMGCRHCPYRSTSSLRVTAPPPRQVAPSRLVAMIRWMWRAIARLFVSLSTAFPRQAIKRRDPAPAPPPQRRKKSSLYTRKGDGGYTRLLSGGPLPKYAVVCEAMGDVDELSVKLGLAAFHCSRSEVREKLEKAQRTLIEAGAVLAARGSTGLARRAIDPGVVDEIERDIDAIDATLPPLRNFVLPKPPLSALSLHDARVVCRRAERHVWRLAVDEEDVAFVAKFLNRLSDYLFAAARQEVHDFDDDQPEAIYNVTAEVRRRQQIAADEDDATTTPEVKVT